MVNIYGVENDIFVVQLLSLFLMSRIHPTNIRHILCDNLYKICLLSKILILFNIYSIINRNVYSLTAQSRLLLERSSPACCQKYSWTYKTLEARRTLIYITAHAQNHPCRKILPTMPIVRFFQILSRKLHENLNETLTESPNKYVRIKIHT